MRTAAISCLVTCGAMVAGPGIAGGAVASADLLGIDLDIFDIFCHNDKKCDHDNDRRGVPGVGSNVPEVRINGIPGTEVPKRGLPGATGGGGGVPRSGGTNRPSNLPPVPTAPGSREIVIRNAPAAPAPAAPAPAAPAPAAPAPMAPVPSAPAPMAPAPAAPVVVPPIVVPPVVVSPMLPPAPVIGPVVTPPPPEVLHPPPLTPPPLTPPPRTDSQPASVGEFGPKGIPATIRAGYADYLRAATVGEIAAVAVPGTAGIFVITTLGGLVGFRQARAAQALPPANIANVVRFLQ
jgi:hypothetical protein